MGLFFTYIIKSTICLAVFYLFYKLLLSRETFHRFNRIALLSLIFLSVIIPLIKISTEKVATIQYPMYNLEQLLLLAEPSSEKSTSSLVLQIILLLYITGVVAFVLQHSYSVWKIQRIIRSGKRVKLEKQVTLVITHKDIVPFSWRKYIIISAKDWEENNQEIVTHEMAHIRYHHSWDIFISSLCVVFHWFNPAAWLLKQELQNIHEYEADENVIHQGIDAKRYQLLLIKKAVGSQRFTSMANSFNHSKLKKRITMMLKSKSNTWARLKYLYVLPLVALTVTAFARPEISRELDKISSIKISDFALIKEAIPKKNESLALSDTLINQQIHISEEVRKELEEAKKHLEEINIQEEIEKALVDENIELKIKVALDALNNQVELDHILQDLNLENIKVDLEDMNINLEDIKVDLENMKVHLEDMKLQEQVMKAQEQVIKDAKIEEQVAISIQEVMIKENVERVLQDKVQKEVDKVIEKKKRAKPFKDATIFIDDVKVSYEELEALDHERIESVSVLKDKVIEEDGKEVKGVILIKTKKNQ